MKRGLILACLALALAAIAPAQDKPDFSGTWVLDREQSDSPPVGRGGGGGRGGGSEGEARPQVTLVIAQSGKIVNITRKMAVGGQERLLELKYTTDDAPNTNPAGLGGPGMGGRGARDVVSKTRWDGNRLVTEWSQTRESPDGEIRISTKVVRSLSADRKILTEETTTSGSPRGDMTRKMVYNRQ